MSCPRCGSTVLMEGGVLDAIDRRVRALFYARPENLVFRGAKAGHIRLTACARCGHVEMTLEEPEKLYAQLLRATASGELDEDDPRRGGLSPSSGAAGALSEPGPAPADPEEEGEA